jgi:hypothetical protein
MLYILADYCLYINVCVFLIVMYMQSSPADCCSSACSTATAFCYCLHNRAPLLPAELLSPLSDTATAPASPISPPAAAFPQVAPVQGNEGNNAVPQLPLSDEVAQVQVPVQEAVQVEVQVEEVQQMDQEVEQLQVVEVEPMQVQAVPVEVVEPAALSRCVVLVLC